MDACGALGLFLLAFYTVRIMAFGQDVPSHLGGWPADSGDGEPANHYGLTVIKDG